MGSMQTPPAIQLQPRPLYGIGTVARLTGIKPDTLRIWERRYQLGASHKSPSGRRQYTQTDLEHLQLVAGLVAGGARIGEIARSDRRTLEVLLRARQKTRASAIPARKTRVLFVGKLLCGWLEERQGCLSNIDAMLAPCALEELSASMEAGCGEQPDGQHDHADRSYGEFQELVVECTALDAATLQVLKSLAARTGNGNILVLYGGSNERGRVMLEEQGVRVASLPPEPSYLAFHFNRGDVHRDTARGSNNLAELVDVQERVFSDRDLSLARTLKSSVECACPRDLADLVSVLAEFEDSSAQCAVENWQDAAVQACVYAYAGQARWLMEKALGLMLEEREPQAGVMNPG